MNASTLASGLALIGLAACDSVPVHYRNTLHPAYGQADFDRDSYQCKRENQNQVTFVYGGIAESNTVVDDSMAAACLSARGWHRVVEQQQLQTQQQLHRTNLTFANWTLRCVGPDAAAEACEVTQTIYDKGQPVAQTAIGRPSKAEALRFTILVPDNIRIETRPKFTAGEGEAAIDLTWRRCLPAGCLADVALSDEQVKKLRARTENGRIVFQDKTGRDTVIPFAPKGLAPALDALAKEAG
jgi:invasion protein IalB